MNFSIKENFISKNYLRLAKYVITVLGNYYFCSSNGQRDHELFPFPLGSLSQRPERTEKVRIFFDIGPNADPTIEVQCEVQKFRPETEFEAFRFESDFGLRTSDSDYK